MKTVLAIFALSASIVTYASPSKNSVEFSTNLSTKSIDFLKSKSGGFYAGTYQGEDAYGAQVECSGPKGYENDNVADMKCYVRSTAGFSRGEGKSAAPIKVPPHLALLWMYELSKADFSYLVTHGFSVLGGTIHCSRDVGSGQNRPDGCTLSKLNF